MKKNCAKLIMAIGMVAALFLTGGCSQASESGSGETVTTVSKSLTAIYTEIESSAELPKMVALNDNYISNYFGIDLNMLEEYVFTNAEEVIYADTIIMMKVKEGKDTKVLEKALDTLISQKKAELENYLPQQFAIVEKSKVRISGNYVYLVISENAESIEAIIEQYTN